MTGVANAPVISEAVSSHSAVLNATWSSRAIIGISGAEYGIRGYVTAYDAASGDQVWRFYTIPSPDEGGWYLYGITRRDA